MSHYRKGAILLGIFGSALLLSLMFSIAQRSARISIRLAAPLICLVAVGLIFSLEPIDDTYISLQYAKHFAQGNGLVFNPGERVEGYTCFLWVLLLGLIKAAIPAVNLVALSTWLGVTAGVGTLLILHRFALLIGRRPDGLPDESTRNVHLTLFLLAGNFTLTFWLFSGMETGLYLLLSTAASYQFCSFLHRTEHPSGRSLMPASIFWMLALMTRPETALPVAVTVLFILARRGPGRWRSFGFFLLPFILIYTPYFFWRFAYYGYLLPNTFYAKVGGLHWANAEQGFNYILRGLVPYLPLFLPLGIRLVRTRMRLSVPRLYLLALLATTLVAVIFTGADHFRELRYFIYMLPPLFLLTFDEITTISARCSEYLFRDRPPALLYKSQLAGLLALLMFLTLFVHRDLGFKLCTISGGHFAARMADLGRRLGQLTRPEELIATPAIGAIAYFSDRRVIDMCGLADTVIAHTDVPRNRGMREHERYNTEYLLGREPSYIVLISNCTKEEVYLKSNTWIPALEDLKRYLPNQEYEFTVIRSGARKMPVYRRISPPPPLLEP